MFLEVLPELKIIWLDNLILDCDIMGNKNGKERFGYKFKTRVVVDRDKLMNLVSWQNVWKVLWQDSCQDSWQDSWFMTVFMTVFIKLPFLFFGFDFHGFWAWVLNWDLASSLPICIYFYTQKWAEIIEIHCQYNLHL